AGSPGSRPITRTMERPFRRAVAGGTAPAAAARSPAPFATPAVRRAPPACASGMGRLGRSRAGPRCRLAARFPLRPLLHPTPLAALRSARALARRGELPFRNRATLNRRRSQARELALSAHLCANGARFATSLTRVQHRAHHDRILGWGLG